MFDQQLTFDGRAEDVAPVTKQDRLFVAPPTMRGQMALEGADGYLLTRRMVRTALMDYGDAKWKGHHDDVAHICLTFVTWARMFNVATRADANGVHSSVEQIGEALLEQIGRLR